MTMSRSLKQRRSRLRAPARPKELMSMNVQPLLAPDAELVLGIAATAIPFARTSDAEAERWLRVLRLHGEVGVALQGLGVSEVPLAEPGGEQEHPAHPHAGAQDAVAHVTEQA